MNIRDVLIFLANAESVGDGVVRNHYVFFR